MNSYYGQIQDKPMEKEKILRHTDETKEKLREVLNETQDSEVKKQILKRIQELENEINSPIEYMAEGESSKVFSLGDKVIKFSYPQNVHTSFSLTDIETMPYSEMKVMRIIPKLELNDITNEDAQYVYNQLRKEGIVWADAHNDNLGRIPGSGKDKSGLRIIDDGYLFLQKDISGSVFDHLAKTRQDMLIREVNYQRHINPKFKLSDIKKMMKSDIFDAIARNDSLIDTYKLHIRKGPLQMSKVVIDGMKFYEWNEAHRKDGVQKMFMPGIYPTLYKVYDDKGELQYLTKINPLLTKSIKKIQQKITETFFKKKTLQLPSNNDGDTRENSLQDEKLFREQLQENSVSSEPVQSKSEHQGRTIDEDDGLEHS